MERLEDFTVDVTSAERSVTEVVARQDGAFGGVSAHCGGWTEVIESRDRLLSLRLHEVWRYRDLLWMFVVRDFVTVYKQTILGPLWFFIQPVFTTIVFTVIFGRVAGISTDGIPKPLFYLSGLVLWNYFSECFTVSSSTFRSNQGVFGKVYFPRLVLPLSVVVSRLLKLGVQLSLFLLVYLVYLLRGADLHPNVGLLLVPVLVAVMAGLSLGFGFLITSLTTKYRDFAFLVGFGVQLWMYATPIIYPLSLVSEEYRWCIVFNPMTSVLEAFRFAVFGTSAFEWTHLLYTFCFTIVLLFAGIVVFSSTEKSFMDTV